MSRLFHVINILIICMLVEACGQTPYSAPVNEFGQPPSDKVDYHIVSKGETLYSIAWKYSLDYKYLARINTIDSSYTIYPGQKLALTFSKHAKKSLPAVPVKKVTKKILTKAPTAVTNKAPNARSKKGTSLVTNKSVPTSHFSEKSWRWPLKGKVLAKFRSNKGLHKGIDIQANLGEPVYAAAAGRVVYSGNGLRGYGKLLIIKHSEKFLSAYAHNRKLLVKEGSVVKRGQKIAEAGSTGTDKIKLYFEIRYDGKPVDPLKYLPRK